MPGFYQGTMEERRMIDYWEGSNQDGIPQAIKALENKEYIYGKHFLPHDSKATDISTGKTRLQLVKSLKPTWSFEVVPSLSVDDGIERGKLFFNKLWIDEGKCQTFLDYIAQYRQEWDDNKGMSKRSPSMISLHTLLMFTETLQLLKTR
jgi:phage terminase large subunit